MWHSLWDHMGLPSRRRFFFLNTGHPGQKNMIWLVVDLPLWKIWKSVGMIIPYIYIHIVEIKKCLNHQPVMQWCNVLSFYMFAIPLHENVNPLEWKKGWMMLNFLIFGDTEMLHANWWHWHLATDILISDTCRGLPVTHPGTTMWSSLPRANGYESKPWYPRYPKIAG